MGQRGASAFPREVLELERWAEVGEAHRHLRRIFVYTLLVACVGFEQADGFFVEGGIGTLIRLTESAIVLGMEGPELALECLGWLLERRTAPCM
jgi:hypothetical protein